MTAKSKSRTSKSKANKKVSAPRWVIAVVLFIVVATGAFLVYSSFAAGRSGQYGRQYGRDVTCNQGYCQVTYGRGNQGTRYCYPSGNTATNYYCVYGFKN